jgi:hypothetical protein
MIINENKSLNNLTITELEKLIETIVKRTLKQETINQDNEILLSTFGSWEDEQTEEEIIEQIYSSRNSNLNLV